MHHCTISIVVCFNVAVANQLRHTRGRACHVHGARALQLLSAGIVRIVLLGPDGDLASAAAVTPAAVLRCR